MRKLRRIVYLSLLAIIGTYLALLLPVYTLLAMFGALTLLLLARQLNFYKIMMMLKRFIQNTRRQYFQNRLRLRTGFRDYMDAEIENSNSRICR
jgi:ABC-type transport system involved in cytochrome bd biosynthesis fused ATPase/permease subunit